MSIIGPSGYASVRGMKFASEGIRQGAEEIVQTTAQTADRSPAAVNRIRQLTETGRAEATRDLEDSFLDIKRHHYGYRANVHTARVDDERFDSMLDMVLPKSQADDRGGDS